MWSNDYKRETDREVETQLSNQFTTTLPEDRLIVLSKTNKPNMYLLQIAVDGNTIPPMGLLILRMLVNKLCAILSPIITVIEVEKEMKDNK